MRSYYAQEPGCTPSSACPRSSDVLTHQSFLGRLSPLLFCLFFIYLFVCFPSCALLRGAWPRKCSTCGHEGAISSCLVVFVLQFLKETLFRLELVSGEKFKCFPFNLQE